MSTSSDDMDIASDHDFTDARWTYSRHFAFPPSPPTSARRPVRFVDELPCAHAQCMHTNAQCRQGIAQSVQAAEDAEQHIGYNTAPRSHQQHRTGLRTSTPAQNMHRTSAALGTAQFNTGIVNTNAATATFTEAADDRTWNWAQTTAKRRQLPRTPATVQPARLPDENDSHSTYFAPRHYPATTQIKIRKFTGTESLQTWLAQFNSAAKFNKWDDRAKLAHLTNSLGGTAADTILDAGDTEMDTFEKLVNALRARFGTEGQTDKFREELRARRQRETKLYRTCIWILNY